jgi:hypothetical protein
MTRTLTAWEGALLIAGTAGLIIGSLQSSVTKTIGPLGGVLQLDDGARVTVPKDTLTALSSMTLRRLDGPLGKSLPVGTVALSPRYRIDGLSALRGPVVVSLPYSPVQGLDEGSIQIYRELPDGSWSIVGSESHDPQPESSRQEVNTERHHVVIRTREAGPWTVLGVVEAKTAHGSPDQLAAPSAAVIGGMLRVSRPSAQPYAGETNRDAGVHSAALCMRPGSVRVV